MSSETKDQQRPAKGKRLPYEPPRAIRLGELARSLGACKSGGVGGGSCIVGDIPHSNCHVGTGDIAPH